MDDAFSAPKAEYPFPAALLLLIVLLSGCQMFHPREVLSIPEIVQQEARPLEFPLPPVQVDVAAYDSLDQSLEVFDCDLPRAGIHPVWLRIRNGATYTLDLEGSHINLISKEAAAARLIPPKLIVDLIYDSYRARMFSPHFRDQLETRFEEMRFKFGKVLPGNEISGYLFFAMDGRGYSLLKGARLRWSDIRSPIGPELLAAEYTFPVP